jgi:exodeoxyribonuclease VII large subunit
VDRERRILDGLRARPVLADPRRDLQRRAEEVTMLRERARRDVVRGLNDRESELRHLGSRLTSLGPAATLARGYSVVQRVGGEHGSTVLRSVDEVVPGDRLRIRVADGSLPAVVTE